MTEKRFVGNFYKGMLISIYDKVDDKNVNILQMVEIANQVVIENEQLKSNINIRDECIIEFQEENESLKQSLANKMDSDAWWEKKAKQRVEELEKENEELKKELDSYKPVIFESESEKGYVTLYEKNGDKDDWENII